MSIDRSLWILQIFGTLHRLWDALIKSWIFSPQSLSLIAFILQRCYLLWQQFIVKNNYGTSTIVDGKEHKNQMHSIGSTGSVLRLHSIHITIKCKI